MFTVAALLCVALLVRIAFLLERIARQGGKAMAFGAEVLALMQRIAPQIDAALGEAVAIPEPGDEPPPPPSE